MAGRSPSTGMLNPFFKSRFVDVPAIVADWCGPARLRDSDILDFGCGEGVSALGLATEFTPRRVVGIDIMPDVDRCLDVARLNLGVDSLPGNLRLHRVQPGRLHSEEDRFDIVYSWSVFEHVDQSLLDHSLSLIRSALKPGGLFLVQIAPLYYSAEGSHLSHVLPEPWIHLRMQQDRLKRALTDAVSDAEEAAALWSTYRTLNKITHQELTSRISAQGFEILRTYVTRQDLNPPLQLLDVFQEDALMTNQVVVLACANG